MGEHDTHIPVLLPEVLEHLLWNPSGTYVDGTFGRGGHSRAILDALDSEGRLMGVDRDPAAVAAGQALAQHDPRFSITQGRFAQLRHVLRGASAIDGVLLDIGVSSPQLDDAARGFSFAESGPLDMRMDPASGVSAADWINSADADEITHVLKKHGEERFARRIARSIIAARPLSTTTELADIVAGAVPAAVRHRGHKHPATRTFQAIRIHVNEEDAELVEGLAAAFGLLKPGGRLAVISFHSLEDRVVKREFRRLSEPQRAPRRLPVPAAALQASARQIAGPVRASEQELAVNPRARSATLRVVEKLAEDPEARHAG